MELLLFIGNTRQVIELTYNYNYSTTDKFKIMILTASITNNLMIAAKFCKSKKYH